MTQPSEISARDLAALDPRRIMIVDVRSAMEYAGTRLAMPHAFAPVTELDPTEFALRHGVDTHTPIYTLCASGARARTAAEKFIAAGFTQVTIITGGLAACRDAGFALAGPGAAGPATSGGPLSLERQVRIAFGGFVALFAALGLWVSGVFTGIAMLMGLGFVFSGITNWCGLALLLTKAPWNKGQSCGGGACAIGGAKPSNTGGGCQ